MEKVSVCEEPSAVNSNDVVNDTNAATIDHDAHESILRGWRLILVQTGYDDAKTNTLQAKLTNPQTLHSLTVRSYGLVDSGYSPGHHRARLQRLRQASMGARVVSAHVRWYAITSSLIT